MSDRRGFGAGIRVLLIAALVASGCSAVGSQNAKTTTRPPETTTSTEMATPVPPLTGGEVDLSLTRDDIDCAPKLFGDDEIIHTTTAHYVVEGNLGAVCFGEEDETLIEAWEVLSDIVPGGQLHDLVVFTAFESWEDGGDVTLAFVSPYDIDGSVFQMSVNTTESEANPAESRLTMLHEFAHVFTLTVTEIDRFEDEEACETYWNGDGCFYEDSVINLWVDSFWTAYIDDFDPYASPTVESGEGRCSIDAGFLGPYAASTPEEDFAETFSAYVFRIPAPSDEVQARYDWISERPGLAEFRDLATAAGYEPQENTFDVCG